MAQPGSGEAYNTLGSPKLATLDPQQADAIGAAQASQLFEPWNLARSRSRRLAFLHGSAQLVVNPVNIGLLHAGVPQEIGAGAHAGAGAAQVGAGAHAGAGAHVEAQAGAAQLVDFFDAKCAFNLVNRPMRGPQLDDEQDGMAYDTVGQADARLTAGVPHPPQPVPLTTSGASAPSAIAEVRSRIEAFTE